MKRKRELFVFVLFVLLFFDAAASTNAVTINEFTIPTANFEPGGITAGPDGNLWFGESKAGNNIGRITLAGVITEFPTPSANSEPNFITAGPDGNLWFGENHYNNVGRITLAEGVVTEFPTPSANSWVQGITAGPDGNLWFGEGGGNNIGRITPAGVITEFPTPTANSNPAIITAGPDGNLWFTEMNSTNIGRITQAGVITEFPIPTANSRPLGIVTGPDGNLWFTEQSGKKIGQLVLATVPSSGSWTLSVTTAGPGSGTVTSSPSGISCGFTCLASYSSGTSVTLTAIANSGSTFTGWSGACSSQSAGATCNVTMNAAEAVTANYILTGTTPFSDVPTTESFASYIEAIYNNAITTGCGSGDYCPSEYVTRDQMAAFLVRATQIQAGQSTVNFTCNGGATCAMETPYFNDVLPATDSFFPYVQKLKELGITTGCGNGNYCPSGNVTRDQMAAFIIRALYGGIAGTYTCNGGVAGASVPCASTTPYFSDVLPTDANESGFYPYIQKMKELGITTGCGNGNYCPSEDVTRDQMAAFLARAFLGMSGGSVSTLNQVYTAKATGVDYFSLPQGIIDQASITIQVVAPQSGVTYLLENNVNYVIDTVGNTFRITILTLNGIAGFTPAPDPNYVYSFNVSYS